MRGERKREKEVMGATAVAISSCLRIALCPLKTPPTHLRCRNHKLLAIVCCFSSSSQTPYYLPNTKWDPFRKKKVVMRVGYIGTDYRGMYVSSMCIFSIFNYPSYTYV